MSSLTDAQYDVAILGAGIAGSTLATILARHKLKVLLIDAGVHPRFVIGESTIPHATTTMRILAERYDIPEFNALTNFEDTAEQVTKTCGQKQNVGFVYHEGGRPIRWHNGTLHHVFGTPRTRRGSSCGGPAPRHRGGSKTRLPDPSPTSDGRPPPYRSRPGWSPLGRQLLRTGL